jgi:hypothetical protein
LQLTRRWSAAPFFLFVASVALPASAWAAANATQASSRVTMFDEPSNTNEGVRVLHPQIDATAGLGSWFNINAGYNVDIVTGATPAVFGRRVGVDAVSAATKFSDTRHLVHGGLGFERPDGGIAFGYAYGWESDYKTSAVSATTHHDLYDHNFTLGLAYTHNFDSVCDVNNSGVMPIQLLALTSSAGCFTADPTIVTRRLHIDTIEPSLSWTMTPRLIIQGGGTAQLLDGFQSNPYRSVALGQQNNRPQEHHPQFRQRYAAFGRIIYAYPEFRASIFAMLRLYEDSWAVRAITGDVVMNKYIGRSLLISGRARYHLQGGASFYRNAFEYATLGPSGQYWTGDRELSPMGNYLLGGKLAYLRRPSQERSAWFVEMEANFKYEILLYKLASIDAPNADRTMAHIFQGSFAIRF